MSDNQKLAGELTGSLALSQPPIALSLCDVPPPGIPTFEGLVPAGCSFWQLAATRMFVTSTKDHELCSIGVHTHHLAEPSPSHQSELQDALQAMAGLDYVGQEVEMGARAAATQTHGRPALIEHLRDNGAAGNSVAMWALLGSKLHDYCEQIATLARANRTLALFHERRREDVASGRRPTVRQSQERLSS